MNNLEHKIRKLVLSILLILYVSFSVRAVFVNNAEYPFVQYSMFGRKLTSDKYRGYFFRSIKKNGESVTVPRNSVFLLSQQGLFNFFNFSPEIDSKRAFDKISKKFLIANDSVKKFQLIESRIKCLNFYEQDKIQNPLQYLNLYGKNSVKFENEAYEK